jgi:multidrug efflux pump subunit AcrA (membrane-fusion protein)
MQDAPRRALFAFSILNFALLVSACSTQADTPESATPAPVRIGAENTVTVVRDTIVVGPIVSGELQPAREATARAEIGGSMTEVAVEEGQAVSRGTLLGRIETRTLDDARQSAESALRSADNQLATAKREMERTETLVKAGAIAARDLDVARTNVTAAEAQLADARARLASAERQIGDTVIRAPIDGIVSRRAVNAGDVVSVGTELFTIIDPSSMRLGRRCHPTICRACASATRSSSRCVDTISAFADESSALRRRPTRRRGRCRFTSPSPTSAGASWRVCSPKDGWSASRPADWWSP